MKKHRLSIRTACYGPYSMFAYEHIGEIDAQYVEIDVPGNPELLKDMIQDEDLDFKIGSFIVPITTDDPKMIEKFKEVCEKTKDFEFEYFFSSTNTKGDFEKNREEGYKILRKLGDIAQSYGKFISLETHPPYCVNANEMLRTMEGVNHPAVRINFDTANIYYYNKLNPGEGINEMEKVKDYIGSFHIKETNGHYKEWFFPRLGHPGGIVDFKRIFQIMDSINFNGIYTLEMEGTKDRPLKSLTMDEAVKEVADSIEYLRNIEKNN